MPETADRDDQNSQPDARCRHRRRPLPEGKGPGVDKVERMAKRFEVKDVDLYYAKFHAVAGRDDDDRAEPGHRADRLLRLRQDNDAAVPQPDARAHARRPASTARSAWTAQDIYASNVDPVEVRRLVGMVFQAPNPFPTMSVYENVAAGLTLNRQGDLEVREGRDRRALAARRTSLGRGQGSARPPGLRPLRGPAAAPLHRAGDRGRAGGAAHGRALLRPRPDRDAGDRGPDRGPEDAATRS